MDPSQSAASASEQREQNIKQQNDSVVQRSFPLLRLPDEVVCMVYTEALSRPSLHFARFSLRSFRRRVQSIDTSHVAMDIEPWEQGEIRSGYISGDILRQVCAMSRDVALRAAFEPSVIRYSNGLCKTVDACTDILCLVHTRTGPPENRVQKFMPNPVSFPTPFMGWFPKLDHEQIEGRLGSIRRGAVLVTERMWSELLHTWFVLRDPDEPERLIRDSYRARYGHLDRGHLGALMMCFRALEAFYLVITDVTEADWDSYYSSQFRSHHLRDLALKTDSCSEFPIACHDYTGSYAEVSVERPIHADILKCLWTHERLTLYTRYPYPEGSTFDLTTTSESETGRLVDAQMTPKERVSLLLGLLHDARSEGLRTLPRTRTKRARAQRERWEGVKLRVLVRKPSKTTPEIEKSVEAPDGALVIPKDEYFAGVDLQPSDPEEKWVKQALGRIQDDSEEWYMIDLANEAERIRRAQRARSDS